MSNYPYDRSFDPPAPVVEVILGAPGIVPDRGVRALLDSGADQTTIPEGVARDLGRGGEVKRNGRGFCGRRKAGLGQSQTKK